MVCYDALRLETEDRDFKVKSWQTPSLHGKSSGQTLPSEPPRLVHVPRQRIQGCLCQM